jgi:hypothetical protein
MFLSSSIVDYIRSDHRLTTCFLNLLTEGIELAQLITKGSCLTATVTETRVSEFFGTPIVSLCRLHRTQCDTHKTPCRCAKKEKVTFIEMEQASYIVGCKEGGKKHPASLEIEEVHGSKCLLSISHTSRRRPCQN